MDRHVRGVHAERLGDLVAGALGVLGAGPDLALAVGDVGDRRRRLHRRMREVRGVVAGLHDPLGAGFGRGHVAAVDDDLVGGAADAPFEQPAVGLGVVGVVGAVVPGDRERVAPLDGRPGVGGDHGHAAQGAEAGGQLHVGQADDRLHPGHGLGRLVVEGLDGAAVDGGAGDRRELHAGQPHVRAEDRAAGDHVGLIVAAHLLGAHVGQLVNVFERDGVRHRLTPGRRGELAVAGPAAARGVDELMVFRLDVGDRHAPRLGGRGAQHVPGLGARAAQGVQAVAHAGGAVGVLGAVALLVAHGLHDADAVAVGLELVGDGQSQGRAHALAHLGACDHDVDGAVRRDGEPGVWVGGGHARQLGRGDGGLGLLLVAAAPGAERQQQAAGGEALEEVAAGQVGLHLARLLLAGGRLDRGADALVGAAAADVAGHGLIDLGV
ncbi:hypothetical protein D3C72_744690 [compost metagenome]